MNKLLIITVTILLCLAPLNASEKKTKETSGTPPTQPIKFNDQQRKRKQIPKKLSNTDASELAHRFINKESARWLVALIDVLNTNKKIILTKHAIEKATRLLEKTKENSSFSENDERHLKQTLRSLNRMTRKSVAAESVKFHC